MVLIDRHMTIKNFETRCVNMKAWARQHGINYDNLYATLTRAAPLKMTEKQLYMIEKLKEDGLYEEAR